MKKISPLLLLLIFLILLLPTAIGRVLLDIAGGLMLLFLGVPLLLGGIGWLGWRSIKSKMYTCESCGLTSFSNNLNCPLCGASRSLDKSSKGKSTNYDNNPASSATIDIKAEDAGEEN